MDAFAKTLCLFCTTFGSAPQPQLSRSAGDIWFTYETLGRATHLLRLSTTDAILDSSPDREQRLDSFARDVARETCRGYFELSAAERLSWPEALPRYAKQYVFRCKP